MLKIFYKYLNTFITSINDFNCIIKYISYSLQDLFIEYIESSRFEYLVNKTTSFFITSFNLVTEPIIMVFFWCTYVCISNNDNLTLLGIYTFFVDIHSGDHKHSYIYRYLCPVVLFKEFNNLLCFLVSDYVFYTCLVIILLWSVNERIISCNYSKSRLLSIYNLLTVVNLFNPFKYCIIFHDCGGYNNHKFIYRKNVLLCANYLGFIK